MQILVFIINVWESEAVAQPTNNGFVLRPGQGLAYVRPALLATIWDLRCGFCSASACWRHTRRTTKHFVDLMVAHGIGRRVLCDAPGIALEYIVVGVLHCLGLGVIQDALGNLFWLWVVSGFAF